MSQVLVEDLDVQLAKLVEQVVKTKEETTILSGTEAIAKIVPVSVLPQMKLKRPGYGAGKDDIIYMADDFDAPLEDFKDYM